MLTLKLALECQCQESPRMATVPFSNSPSFSIFPCALWIGIHSGVYRAHIDKVAQEQIYKFIILFFNVQYCNCLTHWPWNQRVPVNFSPGRVMGFGYNSILGCYTYMIRLLLISDTDLATTHGYSGRILVK